MHPSNPAPGSSSVAGHFATTRWSLIVAAQAADTPESAAALAALCSSYWYPLYAFIRRQGHNAEDASDLTQEFFARLLERDFLASVDRQKGRFRAFLLAACKHFLSDQRDHERAAKRGGGRRPLSFDVPDAEQRYALEPAHEVTPEKLFERRWALTLLEQTLGRLRVECHRSERGPLFDRLSGCLTGRNESGRYHEVGAELGMSEAAVKVAVHRLRRRFGELLRETIAETVHGPEDVDDEIRNLFAALGS